MHTLELVNEVGMEWKKQLVKLVNSLKAGVCIGLVVNQSIERLGVQILARAEIWFEVFVPIANSAMVRTLTQL